MWKIHNAMLEVFLVHNVNAIMLQNMALTQSKLLQQRERKKVNKQAVNENVSIDANWYVVYSPQILTTKVNKVSSISLNRY